MTFNSTVRNTLKLKKEKHCAICDFVSSFEIGRPLIDFENMHGVTISKGGEQS
jgi:hypothetical protein